MPSIRVEIPLTAQGTAQAVAGATKARELGTVVDVLRNRRQSSLLWSRTTPELQRPNAMKPRAALSLTLPNLAGIAGFTVVHQAFVLDPGAAAGWTATNGLAITYGL
tara:strand:+ start:183 stop:503 length:321 start_codon:yes stop_codon:yes gene_type:complete